MKALTEEDFQYTHEQIVEAATVWANFNGFSGESCSECRKTANVLAGGSSWFCVCGHCNYQSFRHNQIPHENPDLGPTGSLIKEGLDAARKQQAVSLGLSETADWGKIWTTKASAGRR